MNTSKASSSMRSLSDETIARIFRYVDPKQLLRCERVCVTFRRVLAKDETWRYCTGALRGKGKTHKERALGRFFVERTIQNIRKSQRGPANIAYWTDLRRSNVILSTLGVEGTRSLVHSFIKKSNPFQVFVRGDTLGLMVEIVQDYLVNKLEEALLCAVHPVMKLGLDVYPEVDSRDLRLVELISLSSSHPCRRLSLTSDWQVNDIGSLTLPEETTKIAIIRKLADRAGVVKLTSKAVDHLWTDFHRTIGLLLRGTLGKVDCFMRGIQSTTDGADIDLYHDMPPIADETVVLVPGFLQETATSLGFNGVYGTTWVAREGKTAEEEMEEARLRYRMKPDPKRVDEFNTMYDNSTDDEISEYEDSDDDFSIYDDGECMDAESG